MRARPPVDELINLRSESGALIFNPEVYAQNESYGRIVGDVKINGKSVNQKINRYLKNKKNIYLK